MLRIVIADDHKIVTDGLKRLLQQELEADIVGIAENGNRALDMVLRLQPDVLLTDLEMEGMDGLELVQKIRETTSTVKILVLSMHNDLQYVNLVMQDGAQGYVLKNAHATVLLEGIKEIVEGNTFIDSKISQKMINSYLRDEKASEVSKFNLSKRELEIIKLLSKGFSTKKIASLLHLSPYTIDTHRKNIHVKLNVHSTAELIRLALQEKLID
ncbi:MAG: response regulator transcription factor [Bacteroidota bacterium]